MADVERAGLVSLSERRTYFDKMRGRVIFPIFDVQERPIAFGGRLLGEAGPGAPKYWNSPETPVFSKSRTLYGLGRARKAIAACGVAVVVEGYTDVVTAHQAGFENVVATLGTSLTEDHVKVLSRLAPTVLLAFDADSAGLKAAFRAAAILRRRKLKFVF
jgi:DNA primase